MRRTPSDTANVPTIALRVDEELVEDLDWYVAELQREVGSMYTVSRSSVVKSVLRERLAEEKRKRGRKKPK